ncbi:hypothetical protein CCACVL1_12240 [Corchorus capsularis]|uniref:Retrotransposon Copia-like N-terminal domain-containing protein n=1 Tax=Corchorus capsularis TaxID=210143 RepID=A0A1R3IGM2_COCAP|nr:hypothetical protein CCACVL1_12240 [Corchorus capsularis]
MKSLAASTMIGISKRFQLCEIANIAGILTLLLAEIRILAMLNLHFLCIFTLFFNKAVSILFKLSLLYNSIANPNTTTTAEPVTIAASSTQLPVKLTSQNFSSWRAQLNALLFSLGLFGYVDGSSTPPSAEITRGEALVPNPAYTLWKRQDKLILHAILTSTS